MWCSPQVSDKVVIFNSEHGGKMQPHLISSRFGRNWFLCSLPLAHTLHPPPPTTSLYLSLALSPSLSNSFPFTHSLHVQLWQMIWMAWYDRTIHPSPPWPPTNPTTLCCAVLTPHNHNIINNHISIAVSVAVTIVANVYFLFLFLSLPLCVFTNKINGATLL